MSERRRIWITGIGLITACGTGVDAFRGSVVAQLTVPIYEGGQGDSRVRHASGLVTHLQR